MSAWRTERMVLRGMRLKLPWEVVAADGEGVFWATPMERSSYATGPHSRLWLAMLGRPLDPSTARNLTSDAGGGPRARMRYDSHARPHMPGFGGQPSFGGQRNARRGARELHPPRWRH
jgi:hypothetical protein